MINPEKILDVSEADKKVIKELPEWKRYQMLCEAFELLTTSAKETKEFTRRYLLALYEKDHKPTP